MWKLGTIGWVIAGITGLAGCETAAPGVCKVACLSDEECGDGLTCGELGRCTDGTKCPCEAEQFLGCVASSSGGDETALFCNPAGDGIRSDSCASGCNAAGYCNLCVPETEACTAEGAITRCSSDGLTASEEACSLPCVAASGSTPIHCGYIQPPVLPDLCDQPATMATLDLSAFATLDTSIDAQCNGGVIDQAAPMPDVCVLRYGTVSAQTGTTRIIGSRALAIVADSEVAIGSVINASAVGGSMAGPGGGSRISGDAPNATRGGGGAGFRTAGGAGGILGVSAGGGGDGGPLIAATDLPGLFGGPRAGRYETITAGVFGGQGGGGLMLVACRGTVRVSGTIVANGGGGEGGRDVSITTSTNVYGAGGGGAGGMILVAGVDVVVTGRMSANGGGGGAACSVASDGCRGMPGQDGQLSTTRANGGSTGNEFGNGNGGAGGAATAPAPGVGANLHSGAGGGAAGYLRVYVPAERISTVTPALASPPIDTSTLLTR